MSDGPLSNSRRLPLSLSAALAAMLVVACGKTPDPAGSPPVVVLPSNAAASAPSGGGAMAITPDDVRAPGNVGVLTLPSDASASAPAASAPLTAGVPPPDPSASLPGATGIVPTSTATTDSQPPSVSPGTKQ
jgi:hypothetical protein